MAESIQTPKELELLKQLVGDWSVGIAMKRGKTSLSLAVAT